MAENSKGRVLKATIAVTLSLVITLGLAEAGASYLARSGAWPGFFEMLGQARPPMDTRSGAGMYYTHPYSAYALKPGYTRYALFSDRDQPPREHINQLGFRGAEITPKKADDVYRVIAVGGSTTFGVYLPQYETYPFYLQQELRERLGTHKIEVVNAGLTGSTATESFHRLSYQILPAEPDMVVIYHAYNDLLPRVFDDYQEDYFHFRRVDPNNPPGLSRFYIYRLALAVLSPGLFHENYNLGGLIWKTDNLPVTDTERTQNFLDSNNDAFRRSMDHMISLLQAKNIDVVLATFAIAPGMWHWNDHIPPYLWELGLKQNNAVIKDLAQTFATPLVPFRERAIGHRRMYNDSIHMTAEGNQFKARIFADTIAPLIAAEMGIEPPLQTAVEPAAQGQEL